MVRPHAVAEISMAQGPFRRFVSGLLDGLVFAQARATVAAYSVHQHARIRRLVDAAARRERAAAAVAHDRCLPVALALLAQAGRFRAAALLVSRDPDVDLGSLDGAALFNRVDALLSEGALGMAPDAYTTARSILIRSELLAFDDLGSADLNAGREIVEPTLRWLRARVETRTVAELRHATVKRLIGVFGLTVACAGVIAGWLALRRRPPNVALHRPVTASSQWPGSPAPAGATNGEIETTYGVATNNERDPWIRVDLGEPYRVLSVTVHQRTDGKFVQGFPMSVELSQNDADWIRIGYRDRPSADDWTIETGRRARYVRVQSKGMRVLALAEIEVRAKK
jgi:hypothetical protein